jgi:hypothetical protein
MEKENGEVEEEPTLIYMKEIINKIEKMGWDNLFG